MTSLDELKNAIQCFREGHLDNGGEYPDRIADCLTDPTPITRYVLAALGFEDRSQLGKQKWRHVSSNGQIVEAWEHNGGYSFVYAPEEKQLWRSLLIQPQSVGSLYSLLLQLT